MRHYTTRQVAKLLEISWLTLYNWKKAGKVKASQSLGFNGGKVWLWTAADLRAAKLYKSKNYRKGRGRKKQQK